VGEKCTIKEFIICTLRLILLRRLNERERVRRDIHYGWVSDKTHILVWKTQGKVPRRRPGFDGMIL
jgi:hypothetical protein